MYVCMSRVPNGHFCHGCRECRMETGLEEGVGPCKQGNYHSWKNKVVLSGSLNIQDFRMNLIQG